VRYTENRPVQDRAIVTMANP